MVKQGQQVTDILNYKEKDACVVCTVDQDFTELFLNYKPDDLKKDTKKQTH